jgi:hypothetical protein
MSHPRHPHLLVPLLAMFAIGCAAHTTEAVRVATHTVATVQNAGSIPLSLMNTVPSGHRRNSLPSITAPRR